MTTKFPPATRQHTLEQILEIDFDRLWVAEVSTAVSGAVDFVNPRTSIMLESNSPMDPPAGASMGVIPQGCASTVTTFAMPPFFSLGAAAEWLGVSLSTVKRMVGRGDFATVRIGDRRKIPLSELRDYTTGRLAGLRPGGPPCTFSINGA